MYYSFKSLKDQYHIWLTYRNLPNKGALRSSKVRSDRVGRKLRSPAFQRWFRIENWTIIKETMSILAICYSTGFLQTMGAPLLGEAPLIGRLRYTTLLLCNFSNNSQYLELYKTLPFGEILIIALGIVTQWEDAAFSVGKNTSGSHSRSNALWSENLKNFAISGPLFNKYICRWGSQYFHQRMPRKHGKRLEMVLPEQQNDYTVPNAAIWWQWHWQLAFSEANKHLGPFQIGFNLSKN